MSLVRNNLIKTVGISKWIDFRTFSGGGRIVPPSFRKRIWIIALKSPVTRTKIGFLAIILPRTRS